MKTYDIFISYRRSGGEYTAKILKDRLEDLGYKVFFDVESLRSGDFNTKLYSVIEECTDFLLILSPDSLDRCEHENDWLRLEIMHALAHGLNIVPVMLRGFEFPVTLPEAIEPLRFKNGIEANSEFFDAFIGRLTKDFLKSNPNLHNRITQNILFRRTWPVLLSLLVLTGIIAGGVAIYSANSTVYPRSRAEKNLTDEVLQYLQENLAFANIISTEMNTAYRACSSYIANNDSFTYQEASSAIDDAYAKIHALKIADSAMKDTLSSALDDSPLHKADIEAVNGYLDDMRTGMLDNLIFVKSVIDPQMSMDISVKQRMVELNQQSTDLFAYDMVYTSNILLLPVSEEYLKDFKQKFLPELTGLPFGLYTWQENEEELNRLLETNYSQYEAVVNEISTLVGNQNFDLMQEKADLIEYAVGLGLSKDEAEEYVAGILGKSDDITELKNQLNEKLLQLESLRQEAQQKFAPTETDDAETLWGKMLRFLNLSLYEDAIKCAQAYQLKVSATDDNAAVYMPVVIQYIKKIGSTGIDYGLIVLGYEPGKPHNELYKIGDIIVGLNGQPCRNFSDYEKLSKESGNVVTLMRLNEQGDFDLGDYNVPTGQGRVLLYNLTEKE